MCTPSAPPLLSCVFCILFTKDLVQRTLAHPKYAANYSFEKDASWITASPCGDGCADLPQVVALDCEMCLSEDPVDKSLNGKELVRLSIINGANGEPLMDTLVRPGNPVVDWRTSIHGVAPEHMEGVLFTHRHAQAAIARICCQRTVIIGHALNNDLESLKMTHDRIVDTSFLFKSRGKDATPSLKDVVKATLGKTIQDGAHDSVTDAKCTLDAAKYALDNAGAPLPPISRTKRARPNPTAAAADNASESDKKRREERALMVHRLPAGTTLEQLTRVMQKKTRVVAVEVEPISFSATTGKTQVVYASRAQADIAFNGISTSAQEDRSGRLEKKIFISEDGHKYIKVRHNVQMSDEPEQGEGEGLASVPIESDTSASSSSEDA
eukprot:jgi/Undpi1/2809/HiC_scaffold_14.g06186.m1